MIDTRALTTLTARPLPMKVETEAERIGAKLLASLDRLGFTHQDQDGRVFAVTFRDVTIFGDKFITYEVDVERLWRIAVTDLAASKVIDHMKAITKRPVAADTRHGLAYAVMLKTPEPPKPWPGHVALPEPPEDLAYPWPFGVDRNGQAHWGDLLKTGHLLIGGKPGAGKSTAINAGLVSLLRRHSPETLRLVLVDPKAVELSPYAGIPHLALPVATKPETAEDVVTWLVNEVERREALFTSAGVKKLTDYNKAKGIAPLPLVLAVIDEVTDLVIQWGGAKSAPFLELVRVASKARAFGVVLCLATQNPKADILDTSLRENTGTRIAFKVDLASHSRVILGQSGAETLPPGRPGRLVTDHDGRGLKMLQGFEIADQQVADLVAQLRDKEPSPFSPIEAALIAFARDRNGGAFNLGDLYVEFKGLISWRKLQKLGRQWEARGWLSKPADAVSPRRLTGELQKLAERVGPEAVEAVKRSKGSEAVNGDEEG